MKYREHRPDHDHSPHAGSRGGSTVAPHRIAPGKRTLTMGLAPRNPAGAPPLQRKPEARGAAPGHAGSQPVEDWMRVAMRPDLYQTPILRKSAHEVGYVGDGPEPAPACTAGAPLPAAVQARMEQAFGADLSAVRVHEGPQASAVGALEQVARGSAVSGAADGPPARPGAVGGVVQRFVDPDTEENIDADKIASLDLDAVNRYLERINDATLVVSVEERHALDQRWLVLMEPFLLDLLPEGNQDPQDLLQDSLALDPQLSPSELLGAEEDEGHHQQDTASSPVEQETARTAKKHQREESTSSRPGALASTEREKKKQKASTSESESESESGSSSDSESSSDSDAEPRAYPTGIEATKAVAPLDPADGYYGATFVHGFTSSSGDYQDLPGIEIKEVIRVGRNDLAVPAKIEIARTQIGEDGTISDVIGTAASRIHASVPRLRQLPAVYETPQTLHWRHPGDSAWTKLADIDIRVEIINDEDEDEDFETLVVRTTDNGKSVEQDYLGDARWARKK